MNTETKLTLTEEIEERMMKMDNDALMATLIEKSLIVIPENMPEEYNGRSVRECCDIVKAKPERHMKPVEKKFIRSVIQTAKTYVKEIIKAEKAEAKKAEKAAAKTNK